MSRLTRDGTAKPVSREQILRRERGQVKIHFPCSADRVQDWQPYQVDPYSYYICDHTYIHAINKRTMVCRVVGGARAIDGQAECLKDYMLGRRLLGWKVEGPLRGRTYSLVFYYDHINIITKNSQLP